MNNNTTISFTVPKEVAEELSNYVHDHYMSKSDFIRNAVIEKLQDIEDTNLINKVIKKQSITYTHEEVLRELGL